MSNTPMFIQNLRPTEILIILLIILLLFGAKKLPDLARGVGKSLRIFRAETKALNDDDDTADGSSERGRSDSQQHANRSLEQRPAESVHNAASDPANYPENDPANRPENDREPDKLKRDS